MPLSNLLVILGAAGFVLVLVMFPSFRNGLKVLLGGFLNLFIEDTAKFLDQAEAAATLNEFVEIAKTLDGSIIQIEGNINMVGESNEVGEKLSYERANTVANYLISQGIDGNRIVIVGNGNRKMIGDPNTEEGKIANRRTDVMFKMVEG